MVDQLQEGNLPPHVDVRRDDPRGLEGSVVVVGPSFIRKEL